jgi:dTMP kinase
MGYQGYGRGLNLNLNFIESLNKYSSKGIIPDLTFVIDVDEKNLARLYNRDYKKDRFDLEHLNFHRNVAEGFRRIAKKNLNLKRCVLIDYEAGVNIVQDKLREEFSNRYLK